MSTEDLLKEDNDSLAKCILVLLAACFLVLAGEAVLLLACPSCADIAVPVWLSDTAFDAPDIN